MFVDVLFLPIDLLSLLGFSCYQWISTRIWLRRQEGVSMRKELWVESSVDFHAFAYVPQYWVIYDIYVNLTTAKKPAFSCVVQSDEREFEDVRRAFLSMNINHEEQDAIFMMCSGERLLTLSIWLLNVYVRAVGILMLGNVTFIAKTIAGQDRAADLTSEGRKLLFTVRA